MSKRKKKENKPQPATPEIASEGPIEIEPVLTAIEEALDWALDIAAGLVRDYPEEVDAVASRTGDRIFVNLVNTRRDRALRVKLRVGGKRIAQGEGTLLAEDPTTEISSLNCRDVMQPRPIHLAADQAMELPPASVISLRLEMA